MTEPAGFIGFNNTLFERMRDMHRSWLERLREIGQIESEFGTRLLTAKSPSEATAICNEWMTRRLETVACEQQAFAAAWLGLDLGCDQGDPCNIRWCAWPRSDNCGLISRCGGNSLLGQSCRGGDRN